MKLKIHFEKNIDLGQLVNKQFIPFGCIYDEETEKMKLEIYILKDGYAKTGYHCMVSSQFIKEDDGNIIGICYISEYFYFNWYLIDRRYLSGVFFHELGHIVNRDFERDLDNIKKERVQALTYGKVDSRELKADLFAIQHVGKENYIKTLEILIELRKKRNDRFMERAILEMEKRINAIK